MTIGNFNEVIGTPNPDTIEGEDLQIVYGLNGADDLSSAAGSTPTTDSATITVGGSGGDIYRVGENSTLIVIEDGNSTGDRIIASGIDTDSATLEAAIVENRHLLVRDTTSNQQILIIDGDVEANRIETFELANGVFSFEQIRTLVSMIDVNVTFEELVLADELDFARVGLTPTTVDQDLETINNRQIELLNPPPPTNTPPEITSTASFSIAENTAAVGTITATDADDDSLTFSFSTDNPGDSSLFSLDSSTGVLSFNTAPDFEMPGDSDGNNEYVLGVEVTDGTDTTSQALTVTVTDVDETTPPPANTAPALTGDTSFTVAENTTGVTTLTATDADAVDTLTFGISGGADQDFFNIDPAAGVLSFVTGPDFEQTLDANGDNVFEVQASVSDGTTTVTEDLLITVTDVAEPISDPIQILFEPDAASLIGAGLVYDASALATDAEFEVGLEEDVLDLGTDATFDNLVGFYEIVDLNGGVDTNGDGMADLNPDQEGYALAAITNRVDDIFIQAGSSGDPALNTTEDQLEDVVLLGGRLYAPFLIANGGALGGFEDFIAAENAEADGDFNDAADTVDDQVAYFAFLGANPDGAAHIQSLGMNTFGFEDLPGNIFSDMDFNDAIFRLEIDVVA